MTMGDRDHGDRGGGDTEQRAKHQVDRKHQVERKRPTWWETWWASLEEEATQRAA